MPRQTPSAPAMPHGLGGQWLLLCGGLLLTGAILGWLQYSEYRAIDVRERERLAVQARVIHDNLSRQVASINAAMQGVMHDLPLWQAEDNDMASANRRLRTLVSALPGLRTMALLNAEGVVQASSRVELLGADFGERSYFRTALSTRDPDTLIVGPPFMSVLGTWTMTLARIVHDHSGRLVGVVSASVDPHEFETLLDSVRYTPDMWTAVVHGSGRLFLMMPTRADLMGKELGLPGTMFTRHVESSGRASMQAGLVHATGEQRLLAQQTVAPPELRMDQPLVVWASRDLRAIHAGWRHRTANLAWLLAGLCVFSAAALWALQRRQRQALGQAAQAQAALHAQRERLERIAENVPGMLYQFELQADGHSAMVYCSRGIEELHGVPPQAVQHDTSALLQTTHPDDLPAMRAALTHSARTLGVWQHEYRALHPRLGVRWLSGLARPQALEDGSIVWYGYIRDITQAKEQQLALQQAKDAADAASQAKGRFVANVSHEIRTPLNAILGMLQLLQSTPLAAQQQDYVAKAQGAARALLAVVNDILDFSRLDAGATQPERRPFALDQLLRNLSVLLAAALGDKPVELLFQLGPHTPRALVGDALRLQQVLLNLAGNALKFTARGEVVLSLRPLRLDDRHARIEFAVRDTGIGIAPDRLEAIFESFTQAEDSTTREYGGTGLGLAISQHLVRLMGGQLQVSSTPGQGSRFTFVLDFERAAPEAALPTKPAHHLQGLRLLIVDDNASTRQALQDMGQAFGWDCASAAGMQQAEALWHQAALQGAPFDAACVDGDLPGLDDPDALRAWGADGASALVCMTSMHGQARLLARSAAQALGTAPQLIKPVTPSALFDAVAQATGGASVLQAGPAPAETSQPLAGLRVLLVEDNPLNQQVARELLAQAGAQVALAGNGREGVEQIRTALAQAALPDAVLMDIQMPVMDGYEATRQLRALPGASRLPIIAMTANAQPADRQACHDAGMDDHLSKPVDRGELIAAVLRHFQPGRDAQHTATLPVPAAPGAAATEPARLPELPEGFDLPAALQCLGGDRALYTRLLHDFAHGHGDAVVQVRQLLEAGERNGARRGLHTLKGLCATLGATALAQQCAQLQAQVEQDAPAQALHAPLQRLDAALAEALALLQQAGTQLVTAQAAPPADTPRPADTAVLRRRLQALDALLAGHSMDALDAAQQLATHAGGDARLATLQQQVQHLDFAQARSLVSSWLSALHDD
ncbi:response regulator [Oryzisolibacter propanilivorax]|nr:response regulator [Oryzisolibacter propanilivorax]